MCMRRKLIFLSFLYSKELVDDINLHFENGYELEDILNADDGYYFLLIKKDNKTCDYKHTYVFDVCSDKSNLIEETQMWVKTSTNDIVFETSTKDTLPN